MNSRDTQHKKIAVIIGAGPAGLTGALELLERTGIHPIVCEQDPQYVGGISRTVNYKGNRIDLGGHRFFSKSDRVMQWWARMLPIRIPSGMDHAISYQQSVQSLTEGLHRATDADGDFVMEVRPRKTRIIYGGQYFAYPVELSFDTLRKLGLWKTAKIGMTYLHATAFPRRPETTLEDFFINRFGRELYLTFFKSYTEKVWGIPCSEMSAEWGAQRVKGLSVTKVISHATRKLLRLPSRRKKVETSLIEQFLYPTYGPGFLWEQVAAKIQELGGEIRMGASVVGVDRTEGGFTVRTESSHGKDVIHADYIFSTTDVRSLFALLSPQAPQEIRSLAEGLQYRDFLTVGLLLNEPPREPGGSPLTDTWMYIHEPGIHAGRVQLFHNWQPKLLRDPAHGWIGLEYFCNEGDGLWSRSDAELIELAGEELASIGFKGDARIIDGTVVRQRKTYPAYFGTYDRFDEIRAHLDTIPDLFPIGRNGMHRYNNQDHSMLAAMAAVDCILGTTDKSSIWEINTEQEYHEEK